MRSLLINYLENDDLATGRQLLHCEELDLVLPNVVPTQAIWRTVEVLCALQNIQTLAIVYGPSGTSRAFVVTSRPAVVAATAWLRFGDTSTGIAYQYFLRMKLALSRHFPSLRGKPHP